MLRCLADAEAVATRLTQAWAEANATVARPAPAAEIDADRVRGARGETPQPVSA
jgi:hypothetical protein